MVLKDTNLMLGLTELKVAGSGQIPTTITLRDAIGRIMLAADASPLATAKDKLHMFDFAVVLADPIPSFKPTQMQINGVYRMIDLARTPFNIAGSVIRTLTADFVKVVK